MVCGCQTMSGLLAQPSVPLGLAAGKEEWF